MLYAIILVLVGVALALFLLWKGEREERHNRDTEMRKVDAAFIEFKKKYEGVVDAEAERERILAQVETARRDAEQKAGDVVAQAEKKAGEIVSQAEQTRLNILSSAEDASGKLDALKSRLASLQAELRPLDEEANLRSFGLYKPHYDFSDSERYERALDEIREKQKDMLKEKTAAVADQEWTVNGSVKEGRKQINQTIKLMLRAFNGECDAAIAKVKYNNVKVMEARIEKAFEAINGLTEVQQCRITREYLNLKLAELYLAHEYQEKVQTEKEAQRRIREQMREEEIAQRELEKAKKEAEDEERRYEEALRKAREEVEEAQGAKQQKLAEQIVQLEQRLAEAHTNKERALSRAQMTRSGHVYVISNLGSFGEHVFKIGMTRRLEPMDRIKELGDASVPFSFDVHAIIYADDAPALESTLHNAFHQHRVNRVNDKKEFFRVSIDEITNLVRKNCGDIQLTKIAEAEEYRKTVALQTADGLFAAGPQVLTPVSK